MLYPIIPNSSLNALKIFDIRENDIKFSTLNDHTYLKSNKNINKINILFKKIEKKND
jgi:methionyl-tRNA synthetase